jgi:hypothetical protein
LSRRPKPTRCARLAPRTGLPLPRSGTDFCAPS